MRVLTCVYDHRVPPCRAYGARAPASVLRTVRACGAGQLAAWGTNCTCTCAVRVPASGVPCVPRTVHRAPQAAECASQGSHAVALAETSRTLYVDSAAVCARLVEQP